MIYWKLFKNRTFLLILCIISLVAACWSFIHNKEKEKAINSAPTMYCIEYRDTIDYPSILAIVDFSYAENYINYFSGKKKNQDFRSYPIPTGSRVKILDSMYEGKLAKVILIDKVEKRRIYEEFWIWHEFLKNSPN